MLLNIKNFTQKIDTARIMLIAAAAALLFMPAVSEAQQYYTGDGGRGVRVTVSELSGKGLSTQEQSILHFAQGTIIGAFQKFSAMTVFDRQNLENILKEQNLSMSGNFSETEFIRIGHLTNARFVVFGSITKTSANYTLELSVTDVESGERKASYLPKQVSLLALENHSAIREATADLLKQMGVNLTENALKELNAADDAQKIQAENAVAKGIAAQRQGTIVEALSYYIQANNIDKGFAEAASRLNVLTANVTSGNIGENVRNDLVWRDQWVARLKECEEFYEKYVSNPPPFYFAYSTDVVQGDINYEKRTVSLSLEVASYPDEAWFSTLDQVVKTVRQGLDATKRDKIWGLDGWPVKSISETNPFFARIDGYTAMVEILNSDGKSVGGRQTIGMPTGFIINFINADNYRRGIPVNYALPVSGTAKIIYPEADPMAITDNLSVKIVSINGISPETAAKQKNISILPLSEYKGNRAVNIRHNEEYLKNPRFSKWNSAIVIIHHGVTSIPDNPQGHPSIFAHTGLPYVVFPESLTYIGSGAFVKCSMNRLVIPKSVTSIGEAAFNGNNSLKNVTIGSNVKVATAGNSDEVHEGLFAAYIKNGRKAGVYIRPDPDKQKHQWVYKP